MSEIKVSVIVPCYGVEAYLPRCIKSLLDQSLKEMEIIAVDDDSPDRCGEILEEMKETAGDRLRVFHKENGGLSDARNFGIRQARGEYIAFLDGDDFADPALFEALYRKAETENADVCACEIRYVWEDGKSRTVSSHVPAVAEGEELMEVFTRFYPAVWNKLYRKELLDRANVEFKVGAWFEDVEFSHRLFPYIRRIAAVEGVAVNYLQRGGSVTARADRRLFDYLTNFQSILSFFRERGLLEEWHKELEFAACRYLLATFIKRVAPLSKGEFDEAVTEALHFLNTEFPRWRQNPYLSRCGAKGIYLRFFTPTLAKLLRRRWRG
ncbi:MAG: glycosyltransferase [Clostridia bacterium]|nr:glycosyltransferase [Clostridia bacterium]